MTDLTIDQTSDLKFITPDWSAPSSVKALMTTRSGGVSQAPFDSFNVGVHVNDRADDVVANRLKLMDAANLPSEPVWLNQVHGTDVLELADVNAPKALDYDGVITSRKGRVCSVMTADCLPLFICDKAGTQVAALHVGWRGLAGGIVESGVKMFNAPPDKLIAWAGPCIGAQYFEIGEEVRDQLGGAADSYRQSDNPGKLYANLYQLVGERLSECGLYTYSHSELCTYADQDLFFSHRRDQNTGRMASLIWIDE